MSEYVDDEAAKLEFMLDYHLEGEVPPDYPEPDKPIRDEQMDAEMRRRLSEAAGRGDSVAASLGPFANFSEIDTMRVAMLEQLGRSREGVRLRTASDADLVGAWEAASALGAGPRSFRVEHVAALVRFEIAARYGIDVHALGDRREAWLEPGYSIETTRVTLREPGKEPAPDPAWQAAAATARMGMVRQSLPAIAPERSRARHRRDDRPGPETALER